MNEELNATVSDAKRPKAIWVVLIIAILLVGVALFGLVISAYNLLESLSMGSPSFIYTSAIITRLVLFCFLMALIFGVWKRQVFGWYLSLLLIIALAILPWLNYLNPGVPESQMSNFQPQNDAQALGFNIIGPAVYCAIFVCAFAMLCRQKVRNYFNI